MNRKEKEVYVPPRVTVQQVVMEEGIVIPVSAIITSNSITQEDNWGTETPTDAGTEENVWVDF
jgi:hypothetical protein